jgi:hypothetical protein
MAQALGIRVTKVCFSCIALLWAAVVWDGQSLPGEPPSLKTDKAAGDQPKAEKVRGPVADNSRCLVCHINFEDEPLAVQHAQANLGCVKCHGESAAHSADENNVTAPEIMFPKAKLNRACGKCHASEKLSERHKPVLAGRDPKYKYCTDCHGEHQIKHRSRNWDKETGKLLPLKPETVKR